MSDSEFDSHKCFKLEETLTEDDADQTPKDIDLSILFEDKGADLKENIKMAIIKMMREVKSTTIKVKSDKAQTPR